MNILMIGGTVFLGRALVDAALAGGHHVTLFNRGKTAAGLYPDLEQIHGDREKDLGLLAGRRWDVAIDTCGYVPRIVSASANLLAGQVSSYVFVSSVSVYRDVSRPGMDEDSAVGKLDDESVEEISGGSYGPLKALCEQAVERALPGRSLLIRPGLIVGPYDASDRFTYWPWRVAKGGRVLAPGKPERGLQFIDVRDLAEWMLLGVENGLHGVYNACGPAGMCTMNELLAACRSESASEAEYTWVEDEWLLEQGVGPWMEMPLWIPENDPESGGFFAFETRKAVQAGLKIRPLHETVRGVLEWLPKRGERPWRAGLDMTKEAALLERYSRR